MSGRFAEERGRLGFANPNALAKALGVSHTTVRRIEEGGGAGSDVLAAFARLGADVHYVLTGERRVGLIDTTLLGICELALWNAFLIARPNSRRGAAIRSRFVAVVYNQLMRTPVSPDVAWSSDAVRHAAQQLVESLDDPLDPEMLERALLKADPPPTKPSPRPEVSVSGDGNRVAGRDYSEGGGAPRKRR